jgi:hypothetical protein
MTIDTAVLGLSYNWEIEIQDASTGEVIETRRGHNLVTTAGKTAVATLISGTGTAFSHMAMGSGGTAATTGDTTLETETVRDSFTSTTEGTALVTFKYLLPASSSNGNVFREAGVFNDATTGTMLNRWIISPSITKSSAIQILVTATFTLS